MSMKRFLTVTPREGAKKAKAAGYDDVAAAGGGGDGGACQPDPLSFVTWNANSFLGRMRNEGRGLHSSTSQLNLSRVYHKKTPFTPYTPLHTPLTRATQPLRAPPIPCKALKLS